MSVAMNPLPFTGYGSGFGVGRLGLSADIGWQNMGGTLRISISVRDLIRKIRMYGTYRELIDYSAQHGTLLYLPAIGMLRSLRYWDVTEPSTVSVLYRAQRYSRVCLSLRPPFQATL